jgi:pimeloyl-ACP methyl ester carboxylesterase
MHKRLNNSNMNLIPETGHMMMLERPTEVAALLSQKLA